MTRSLAKLILLAALLTCVALLLTLNISHPKGWEALLSYNNFMKMDSGHYTDIAKKGYELFSCSRIPGFDPSHHCGNSGWFPGYPLLVKLVSYTGMPFGYAGMVVSFVATFSLSILLLLTLARTNHHTSNVDQPSSAKAIVLTLIALSFSGQIYFYAVFPLSLAIALILASMLSFQNKLYTPAGLFAALAAFTYPGAAWYVGALTLAVFIEQGGIEALTSTRSAQGFRKALIPGIKIFAIGACGLLAVMIIHQLTVGKWNAFFLTQAKYEHQIKWPFESIYNQFVFADTPKRALHHIEVMSLVRACGLILAGVICWIKRRNLQAIDHLAMLQGLFAWLMPLIAANPVTLASLRSGTLMLPMVIVLRFLPLKLLAPILIGMGYLASYTARYFFRGELP